MNTKVPDAWDDDEILQSHDHSSASKGLKSTREKVREEWDEDDDDDEENVESINPTLPDVESTRQGRTEQTKVPTIFKPQTVAPYTSGPVGSSFPPELSFEPQVRILKRPKSSKQISPAASSSKNDQKTLEEREEKYRLARERIFGPSSSPSPSAPLTPNRETTLMELGHIEEQFADPDGEQMHRKEPPSIAPRPVREPLGPGTQVAFSRKHASKPTTVLPPSVAPS